LIIEKIRISLIRLGLSVSKLFQKYDSNKDGILDEQDFIKILSDCQLGLGKNM
jgi:Ca2+-binding EF-hand superfamily protein